MKAKDRCWKLGENGRQESGKVVSIYFAKIHRNYGVPNGDAQSFTKARFSIADERCGTTDSEHFGKMIFQAGVGETVVPVT